MPKTGRSALDLAAVVRLRADLKSVGKRVVFTNGCFDLLHPGHVRFFEQARALGDALIVGLNTDASVRRNKGPERPIVCEDERAEVVAALRAVTAVALFDEATPAAIIEALLPDVLVKGDDWAADQIVGRDTVEAAGGEVVRLQLLHGFSTSRIIDAVRTGGGPLGAANR